MNPPVKLSDLTDALEIMPEEMSAWLDVQTGRVIMVADHIRRKVEDADDDSDDLLDQFADWEAEQVPVARGIANGDSRYLPLPDKFEFHEYHHMERFIGTIENTDHADQLWCAIKGKGAFRYFKDTAHRLGVIDSWYRYREKAMNELMLAWAVQNGVTVDQSPGHSGPE